MATPEELAPAFVKGTPLHEAFREEIRDKANYAATKIQERHPQWNRIERMLRLFLPRNEVDENGNLRNPHGPQQIVVPKTLAIRDAIATQLYLPLVTRSPLTPIRGKRPKDEIPMQLMASVIDQQLRRRRTFLPVYGWILDSMDFGLGAVKTRWVEDVVNRWGRYGRDRVPEPSRVYEGPETTNIDLFRFLPDPQWPVFDFQRGDHCDFTYDISHANLIRRSRSDGWIAENVDRIKDRKRPFSRNLVFLWDQRDQSERNTAMGTSNPDDLEGWRTGPMSRGIGLPHRILEHWAWIIPREYRSAAKRSGLEASTVRRFFSSDEPELWCFQLCDGEVLVDVDPTDQTRYPIHVLESVPDLKSRFNPGLTELFLGPQTLIDWFWNSHVANVSAFVNNQFVYDPRMIEEQDLLDPAPGKRVRLKPEAYGRDLRQFFYQIPWQDATRGHVENVAMLEQMLDTLSGASLNAQAQYSKGRRSATEAHQVNALGNQRLQKLGMLHELMAIDGWFDHQVELTIQNMSMEDWVEITGDLADTLLGDGAIQGIQIDKGASRSFAGIGADFFRQGFQYEIASSAYPNNVIGSADIWQRVLNTIGQNPWLGQHVDPFFIFKNLLFSMGIRNVRDAEMRGRMMDPAAIAEAERRGQLVPGPDARGFPVPTQEAA